MMDSVLLLYAFNHFQLPAYMYRKLMARLPDAISLNASRYRRWQDSQASVYGKLLLLECLRILNMQRSLEELTVSEAGRPFIPNCCDFNISHTDGLVICAMSERGKIGVDTEAIKPIDYQNFKGVFHEREWNALMQATQVEEKFYEIWTLKEAVVKADGRGLHEKLHSWSVVDREFVCIDNLNLQLHLIPLHQNFKVALATVPNSHFTIREVKFF
jgi:4'-phosphopantetheinyl transferase